MHLYQEFLIRFALIKLFLQPRYLLLAFNRRINLVLVVELQTVKREKSEFIGDQIDAVPAPIAQSRPDLIQVVQFIVSCMGLEPSRVNEFIEYP